MTQVGLVLLASDDLKDSNHSVLEDSPVPNAGR